MKWCAIHKVQFKSRSKSLFKTVYLYIGYIKKKHEISIITGKYNTYMFCGCVVTIIVTPLARSRFDFFSKRSSFSEMVCVLNVLSILNESLFVIMCL